MRINKQVLVVLFISLLALGANGSTANITKESIISNAKKRTYYLFVPKQIKAPAPLILLLHGSGHYGLSLVEKWRELAEEKGFIVAGPDSSDSSSWSAPQDGPEFLQDLIEALKRRCSINPRRVYLFGHSAGASFGLQMSLFESQYFAAIAVHAGALTEKAYPIIDFAAARRKIPIAIFSGTEDRSVPITMVRATRDQLRKRDFPIEVVEMPHHDHWYYDLAPKINRDCWEFLQRYELGEDPKYEQIHFR